jgi:hypothetical protein
VTLGGCQSQFRVTHCSKTLLTIGLSRARAASSDSSPGPSRFRCRKLLQLLRLPVQVEAFKLVQVSSYFETGTANLNAHLRFDSEPESDSEASSLASIASARANDRGHRGPGRPGRGGILPPRVRVTQAGSTSPLLLVGVTGQCPVTGAACSLATPGARACVQPARGRRRRRPGGAGHGACSSLAKFVIGPLLPLFPLSDSVPVPSRSAAPIRRLPIHARMHNKGTYAA